MTQNIWRNADIDTCETGKICHRDIVRTGGHVMHLKLTSVQ